MEVGSLREKTSRTKRDQRKNWTLEDEREWLEHHPDDEPLEGYEHATLPTPDEVTHDADLVPDIEPYERSEDDDEIDAMLRRIGIAEAYNRWAGKGEVNPGKRTESIKVRCPNPAHADNNPSAWLNTDKEVWVCAGCGFEGGDKFDIAAWGLGFDVPGYKSGKKFPELRRAIAVDLGYTVRKSGTTETIEKVDPEPEPQPDTMPVEPSPEPERGDDGEPTATVTALYPEPKPEPPFATEIDWHSLLPEGTFLRDWMEATSKDDLPEEYHFWNGLTALGLSVGSDVVLDDYQPVHANLFSVLIGNTGNGKSRSIGHLTRILREVLHYDAGDESNRGVNIIKGIGSGEALIDAFSEVHDDGTGPFAVPVRGLMHFDELASLVGKSSHTGSILKPVLMEFYDRADVIAVKTRTWGTVEARDSFGSCISTTQPNSLRKLINRSDADSGFLNRWVFVWGKAKPLNPYGGVSIDLDKPAASLRSVRTWSATHRGMGMELEGDALAFWSDFFRQQIEPLATEKDADPVLARLDLTFKKLILLFSLNRRESTPSLDSVKDALSLWDYLKVTYRLVGVSISTTEQSDLEDKVIEVIENRKQHHSFGPTKRQVFDMVKRMASRDELTRAIKTLEELEIIEEVTMRKGTRGPGRKTYELTEYG